jgi:hypothetical protein
MLLAGHWPLNAQASALSCRGKCVGHQRCSRVNCFLTAVFFLFSVPFLSHGALHPFKAPRFRLQIRQQPEHGLAVGTDESAFKRGESTALPPPLLALD